MGLQGRLEDEVWDKLAQLSAPLQPAQRKEKPAAPTRRREKPVSPKPRQEKPVSPKPQEAKPVAAEPRRKGQQRKGGKRTPRPAPSRRTRTVPVQTLEQREFERRLAELRGVLGAMQAGNPVNGVDRGVTSARLREACALASWLRASGKAATRKQEFELRRMVLELNLLVKRHPALLRPPTGQPLVRAIPAAREWRPLDVSKVPMGTESSRWFMDPVNSK